MIKVHSTQNTTRERDNKLLQVQIMKTIDKKKHQSSNSIFTFTAHLITTA